MKLCAVLALVLAVGLPGCAPVEPASNALSFDTLISGTSLARPVSTREYAPGPDAGAPSNEFRGRLKADTSAKADHFLLLYDELALLTPESPAYDSLPVFDFEFVQDGSLLIPMNQGPVVNEHPWWEFVLRTGKVWDEPGDKGWSRAAIPFALKERREDCTHNGLMSFLFRDGGEVSSIAFQVTSQTCSYLQFDMSGLLAAEYQPGTVDNAAETVRAVRANRDSRMPKRAIAEIGAAYPDAVADAFGSAEEIAPEDMSAFGFIIDGVHYVGECRTPYGTYPYCDELALPSYSTAKSIVAGFGLMLLEAEYPGAKDALIAGLVPECDESWGDVTIENALDMTTGHYELPDMHGDEDAAIVSTFFLGDHREKIDFACNGFPRKADPGTHLSYHTWDTYLAGVAMNNFLRVRRDHHADFFDDLVVAKIWEPLGLSRLAAATRRTYDDVQQPHTGFGLTLLRDDVARLAQFIGPLDGRIEGADVLDRALFDAVKQRVPDDPGMVAELPSIRYNNGFRSFDVSSYIGCPEPVWVVVLSGFGGIIVAVMPNDTTYYYFSDGNVHRYLSAVRESHKIRPMCQASGR